MGRIPQFIVGSTISIFCVGGLLLARQESALRAEELTADGGNLAAALQRLASEDCDSNGEPQPCDVDCNANNRPDDLDLYMGTSRDCDGNRSPDECQTPAPGDLDGDTSVDAADLAIFRECDRTSFPQGESGCQAADFNGNGRVDCADWRIMRCAWTDGEAPEYRRCLTPSSTTPLED